MFSRYEESAYDPSGFALWRANLIRRDRPLTREELFRVVPVCSVRTNTSPVVSVIPIYPHLPARQPAARRLPAILCLSDRVRDPGRREHTKHMLRLRREGRSPVYRCRKLFYSTLTMEQFVSDVAGTISCGLSERARLGESFGEVRVPHKGDVVSQVMKARMRCWGFLTGWRRNGMPAVVAVATPGTAGTGKSRPHIRFGEDHQPVTESQILSPRRCRMRAMTCGPRTSGFRKT